MKKISYLVINIDMLHEHKTLKNLTLVKKDSTTAQSKAKQGTEHQVESDFMYVFPGRRNLGTEVGEQKKLPEQKRRGDELTHNRKDKYKYFIKKTN